MRFISFLSAFLALASVQLSDQATAVAPSVERLVSLPKLDGTAPARPTWSPDSSQVAFLWNDHGMPFLDVWVVGLEDAAPRRLTRLAPPAEDLLGSGDDLSLDALRQRARRLQHRGVSDLAWHPEGDSLFYVLNGDLFSLNLANGEAQALGSGGGALSVSPDGRWLAMLRQGDLWVRDLQNENEKRLTRIGVPGIATVPIGAYIRPDAYVGRYRWAPDGSRIAFEFVDQREVRRVPFPSYLHDEPLLSEVRRPYPGDTDLVRRMAIIELDAEEPEWIGLTAPNRRLNLEFEWSPDGNQLLIMQGADVAEDRWIYLVDTSNGSVTELWHDHRPRRIYPIFRALFNHDGNEVIFIGDHEDYYRLYSLPVKGGEARRLTGDFDVAGDRSAAWTAVDPQTGDLMFIATEHSPYERHVYRLGKDDGKLTRLTRMPGLHQPFLSPGGSSLALISSNDTTPAELYLLSLDENAEERRITHSPLSEFDDYQWLTPRYVSFPSRIDDFTIHARIIEPPNMKPGKRYPVVFGSIYSNTVLNQWNADRPTSFLQQQMALTGDYITVLVDVRGSVGYGVDFREAFQGDWGRDDLDDLHSAVEYLNTLPYVDPDRIAIWGNSYGGLLVLTGLFRKPGLFAVGVAGAPAVDIHHFTGFDQHLTRRPDTHPHIFEAGSLLDLGEDLVDPLLIIHGVHDDIVPLKTTLMMAEKLKLLGKQFELDIVHDSGHWWAATDHYARYTFGRLNDFIRRHAPPGPR